MNLDSDALQCDLAETYHIYNYRELPPSKVALFSIGLSYNSRIKRLINNQRYPFETLLMANIADNLAMILWTKRSDKNAERPNSITKQLLGLIEESENVSFNSGEDYEKARKEILKEGSASYGF